VAVVGDLPIFVAHHSADCWARPDLYHLDAALQPRVVAGVPPDFFSATGQRWGNPLYDWAAMKRDGFAWWIARLKRQFGWADCVRIDHFRGFAGYWEIPATCPTAIEGRWVPAPGHALFTAIEQALGRLPIIAEDLGVITPDVVALRDAFGLPGMRILQFGFSGDAGHAFLPHNYIPNTVVYSGTHDNDTALGWWAGATGREREFARVFLDCRADGSDVHLQMIRAVSGSVARTVLFPLQDVLGLDTTHRMNIPGKMGCWEWRFGWDLVDPDAAERMAALGAAFGRAPLERLSLSAWPEDSPRPA
jgi:4-alpha-glucanotransferase